ncbi:MAG TPA: ABC transporter permease [Chitinophagaceae bacterium]
MDKQTAMEWEIKPGTRWFELNLRELFSYKDLLLRLVRRDFLMLYQQTLLGPVWIILQPLLTVFTYILIFDLIIGIPTNGIPPFLFYLTGITIWNLFADIFTGLAGTFVNNINIFSKVYFPRMIIPLATTLLHFSRILIQLLLLIGVILFYYFSGKLVIKPETWILAVIPLLLTGFIALGCGLIFAVFIAKYRDLMNLLQLLVRLLLFVSPVFFAVSLVPERLRWIINLNPLSPLFELFRYALVGEGTFSIPGILYSSCAAIVLLLGGIVLFNKKADTLVDVV